MELIVADEDFNRCVDMVVAVFKVAEKHNIEPEEAIEILKKAKPEVGDAGQ